jgi:thiamine-phosphate pyrophosphorylase
VQEAGHENLFRKRRFLAAGDALGESGSRKTIHPVQEEGLALCRNPNMIARHRPITMTSAKMPNRCRLVLIAPKANDAVALAEKIADAVAGGDVASLILPDYDHNQVDYQNRAERVIERLASRDVAIILAGDTRIAGRVGADGIHLESGRREIADAVERLQSRMIVGAGGAKTRHEAMEIGEARPDYVFFGRFGYDTLPEPHPRNLSLGGWWAELVEIPCIVMGGSAIESARKVAETGAEFVALSSAVFAEGAHPADRVAAVNQLLDRHAPQFEG